MDGIDLKVQRIRAGVRQGDIARVTGWSESKVSKVESRAVVRAHDLQAYVQALATLTTNRTSPEEAA